MYYENLDVYKRMYDLLLLFYQCTRRVDRDYRYTLCQDAKHAMHEALFRVYMVTTLPQAQQPDHVMHARYYMARFTICFHLLQSLGQLNGGNVEEMGMAIADCMDQLKRWEGYLREKQKKETQKNVLAQ